MGAEILRLLVPLALCLGIFWVILKASSARIANQHRLLAERFGLEIDQPPPKMGGFIRTDPSLYGRYRGRELSFSAPGKGLKGSRQIESLVKLELRDRTLRAQMTPKGLLRSFGQRAGGLARWMSGDEAFDQAVDVRADHSRILEAVLTVERRARLAEHLRKSKATLYIGDGTIAYAKLGLIADEATRRQAEEVVEFLCDLAEAVEGGTLPG